VAKEEGNGYIRLRGVMWWREPIGGLRVQGPDSCKLKSVVFEEGLMPSNIARYGIGDDSYSGAVNSAGDRL
jgi:hypothetical protein